MQVVVCALLWQAGELLVTRRKPDATYPGMWEFPGGKLEAGETPEQALARELAEELCVEARVGAVRRALVSANPRTGAPVLLLFYDCFIVSGEPTAAGSDGIARFAPRHLPPGAFIPADGVLVAELISGELSPPAREPQTVIA